MARHNYTVIARAENLNGAPAARVIVIAFPECPPIRDNAGCISRLPAYRLRISVQKRVRHANAFKFCVAHFQSRLLSVRGSGVRGWGTFAFSERLHSAAAVGFR